MSSPRYSDAVRVFALANLVLFLILRLVFLPGAVALALLGAGLALWFRANREQDSPVGVNGQFGGSSAAD